MTPKQQKKLERRLETVRRLYHRTMRMAYKYNNLIDELEKELNET